MSLFAAASVVGALRVPDVEPDEQAIRVMQATKRKWLVLSVAAGLEAALGVLGGAIGGPLGLALVVVSISLGAFTLWHIVQLIRTSRAVA